MRKNKKQLYDSIMRNVSKEVKRSLNENQYDNIMGDIHDKLSDIHTILNDDDIESQNSDDILNDIKSKYDINDLYSQLEDAFENYPEFLTIHPSDESIAKLTFTAKIKEAEAPLNALFGMKEEAANNSWLEVLYEDGEFVCYIVCKKRTNGENVAIAVAAHNEDPDQFAAELNDIYRTTYKVLVGLKQRLGIKESRNSKWSRKRKLYEDFID